MSTRRGGKTGYSYAVRKRYEVMQDRFKCPIPKPPPVSKAELRRVAEMAVRQWERATKLYEESKG